MRILFIYTAFAGHVYRTFRLAKQLISEGHEVNYILLAKKPPNWKLPGATVQVLGIFPMYTAFRNYPAQKTINDVLSEVATCRSVLLDAINAFAPNKLFVDEFCSIELHCLIPAGFADQIEVHTPFLPSIPNSGFPPQDRYGMPGPEATVLWSKHIEEQGESISASQKLIHALFSEHIVELGHRIWTFNKLHPAVSGIKKIYLHDASFDFGGQPLKPWEHYGGPSIDLSRPEDVAPLLSNMVAHHLGKNPENKLITVSFGTVIKDLVSDDSLVKFFDSLNALAEKFKRILFIAKLPVPIASRVKKTAVNLIFMKSLPQLFLVKQSSLLITHGGGGAVYEALALGIPLLVIPPKNVFDYPGNAARVVYHQVGLSLSSQSSLEAINQALEELLANKKYTRNAQKWAKKLAFERIV
ncbi:MAG: hypothetical protein JJU34_13200 [Lunatimonas sp.]|uniref:glycosyltransferase n=1 Tax=Lunatimonas sp. TaxID=2060141 RepID=UPI00263B895B|nr:nucleotide disphospho-sugar-binding domain-containing protein [Lunatimonas sp.]MCC5938229.1 hypothetical protein [Lunatimonas sp.]